MQKKDIAILYTKDCIIPKTAEPGKLCTFFEKITYCILGEIINQTLTYIQFFIFSCRHCITIKNMYIPMQRK